MASSPSPLATVLRRLRSRTVSPSKTDQALVASIRNTGKQLSHLPSSRLAERTADLRRRVERGAEPASPDIVVPTCALVVEAARRVLAIGLYDVQLLGGLAMGRRMIAEMQTGEGKTYAALLPACLHALSGAGVHVMTVNAYLAQRDVELLAPVYQVLGISVGLVEAKADPAAKRAAYACDITYGPGYEFGFDYLRDQVALISRRKPQLGERFRGRLHGHSLDQPQPMQRGHAVAIVDEADSVMIDEATTPLVLSGGGCEPAANAEVYLAARQTAAECEVDRHFFVDDASATLKLTEQGITHLATDPSRIPRRGLDRPWPIYVEQALRAERRFRRDVHYVVRDDAIQIVDQYTGRIFSDRSWREGLQQAVQAREGVTITTETTPIAHITRQRYFRLYKHLCGMTGTAQGCAGELHDVYGLNVVVILPHRPCHRSTLPTRVFADCLAKERAIVGEVVRIDRRRQPVLIGTATIETSERLARSLDEIGIDCQLLNGKQDAEEAEIVARAGQLGAVTIATNMAGRGTDIRLGHGVAELGGVHVISTEPQESTRVDRQLVGRAARQGDPGSCQTFASADDRLFTCHAQSLARQIKQEAGDGEIEAATHIARKILEVQQRVENAQAQHRRRLFAHDDWLENVLGELTSN